MGTSYICEMFDIANIFADDNLEDDINSKD